MLGETTDYNRNKTISKVRIPDTVFIITGEIKFKEFCTYKK